LPLDDQAPYALTVQGSAHNSRLSLPAERDLRILLDTSSLLHDRSEAALERFFVPVVHATGQKLIVPLKVQEEIRKHTRSPSADLRAKAVRADDLVGRFRALGVVDLFSDGEQTFADNVMQLVIVRFCERYHFCLLTQDRDLATDVLRLGERRSVRAKSVMACRLGDDGGLDEWYLARGGAMWRPLEAGTPERGPTHETTPFRLGSGQPRSPGAPLVSTSVPAEGDVVVDSAGGRTRLGRTLGTGGEGAVFATDGDLVCKTYHGARLTTGLRDKLMLMLANPVEHPSICWPRSLAMNERGELVGYLMPPARGKELQRTVFVKPLLQAAFPRWSRIELATLAISVLEPMLALHERNVILGDINPLNILVASEREVFFVDSDSYQIEDFVCPVGTATFLAPDLLGRKLDGILRDFSHEYFAVATLVFMMLVPGKPPYSHAGGGDPAENVRTRHFPYGLAEKKGEKVPQGPWRFIWSHLPFYMKEAFHEAFSHDARIATAEWLELLRRYQSDLRRGFVSSEIFPTTFKRLKPEEVRRKGGSWVACRECGDGFGSFEKGVDVCPTCFVKETEVRCFLCEKPFLARASHVQRLAGKQPFCPSCRALVVKRPCRECRTVFELTAGDRAHFKRKQLSLPTRCEGCRARRRSPALAPPVAPAAPIAPAFARLLEQAIPPAKPQELAATKPEPQVRPGGLLDALRRMFGGS
jgi:hypothetical protein